MINNITTRAGLDPADTGKIEFDISTEKAEAFLQEKINRVIKKANESGGRFNEIEVRLLTNKMGNKFHPFILVMPIEALANTKEESRNELKIFSGEGGKKVVKIKKPLYDVLSLYAYNKSDEESFYSSVFRQSIGISLEHAHSMRANRMPRIQTIHRDKNSDIKYVVMYLDPMRIFHDMLIDVKNPEQKFYISDMDVVRINGGNYNYHMARKINNKKKKEEISLDKIILNSFGHKN